MRCRVCGGKMNMVLRGKRWRYVCTTCGHKTPSEVSRTKAERSAQNYSPYRVVRRMEVRCPYYVRVSKWREISCKPDESAGILHCKRSKKSTLLWLQKYCKNRWETCPLAGHGHESDRE